ncbi:MAG: tetratricopeptide repeat protein, partial [Candidatus Thorarchaeota archaeon]
MKPSILKKLNSIIEEANALKDKSKFQKAIDKFGQALNFINIKVDDPNDKRVEIENIKNAINQTYSVEINNIVEEAVQMTAQNEFEKAKDNYQKALEICEKIDDLSIKEDHISEIEDLISVIQIKKLTSEGIRLRDEEMKFDNALTKFNNGISETKKLRDSDLKTQHARIIKREINLTHKLQLRMILQQGTKLKEDDHFEEAIKVFEKAKDFIQNTLSPNSMTTEVNNIKNLSNEIYSAQIKPIIEDGKKLKEQDLKDDAISKFKEALDITNNMYDSDLKNLEVSLIAESMNPIYIARLDPLLEKGREITNQENYNESIPKINEAVDNFIEGLDIAKLMVDSERKDIKIKEINDLINKACLAGTRVIKDRSVQLIGQNKTDEAISEIYIALSLAKRMTYPEEENSELSELKNLVNKEYLFEIKKVVRHGKDLVEQKRYDEAINSFNEALIMTNKMYLTPEMENEVNLIKSLIYDVEVKQLVGEGKFSEDQQLKEKEIEKLNKRFEYAKSIEDDKLRSEEMNKIKKLIDDVHSDEIKLLIEQADQLADKNAFKEAFKFYERALKVNEMMEEPDIKNKDLIKESYKRELIKKINFDIEDKNYDEAIENGQMIITLDEGFVEGYYYIGLVYNYKKKYDAAIETLQKAIDYDKNHVDSWNLLGLAYEAKGEFATALEYLSKSIEIDPSYFYGWYNLGNVYKQIKELDTAINS